MASPNTAAARLLSGSREPVRVATTENITLSGLQTIDEITVVSGERVLAKDQDNGKENGIYTASSGVWNRAPDARTSRSIDKGTMVLVQSGTINAGRLYTFDTLNPNLGDDDISVAFYALSTPADLYSFDNGLQFTGVPGSGSFITTASLSTTNGINLTNGTFSGYSFGSPYVRLWGNGMNELGYGTTTSALTWFPNEGLSSVPGMAITAETLLPATINVYRNATYTGDGGGDPNQAYSAIRATSRRGLGAKGAHWTILGWGHNHSTEGATGGDSIVGIYAKGYSYVDGPTWAGCSELHDWTSSNPTRAKISHEFDMVCNGTDTGGNRVGLFVIGLQRDTGGSQGVASAAIRIARAATQSFKWTRAIQLFYDYDYGIDFETATITNEAIRMAAEQKISFHNGGDAMYYNVAAGGLLYGTGSYTYAFHDNGHINAAAYDVVSDIRLKRNIEPLTGGLSIVEKLKPKWFEQKNGDEWNHHFGFVADELQEVLPDVVTVGSDGIKRVDYSRTPDAVMVSAIQELTASTQELSARLAALESR